jgi:hypothetical protein
MMALAYRSDPPDTTLTRFLPALVLALVACDGGGASSPSAELPALPPRAERASLGPPAAERPLREAIVAFTAEVRGEIEPCGCPTVPYGGFARRSRLLESVRAQGLPVFVVDAGEMLVKGLSGADAGDRPARARAVLDLARATGLDAWAPAPVDLVPGGLALFSGSPAFSANWRTAGDAPALPGSTIVTRDGFRLGIVGLSATPRGKDSGISSVDPVDAVRDAMKGDADAWIVLSNASDADALRVAEGVPGLGAVLSVRGSSHDPPRVTKGAPILETPDRGRYVTLLRLSLGASPGPLSVVEDGPWKDAAQIRSLLPSQPTDAARAATTKRLDAAEEKLAAATAGHDVVYLEDRPLGSDLDGESDLDARIAAFQANTRAAATERAATKPEVAGYATASACLRCHDDFFAAWSETPHARAHEALITRGKATDPECVSCHTTGYGRPGGFSDLTASALRTWKGVQCESCHGPLAGHPDASVQPKPVSAATCTSCHDEANSPGFDYEKYLAKVSCVALAKQRAEMSGATGAGAIGAGAAASPGMPGAGVPGAGAATPGRTGTGAPPRP